MKFDYGNYTQKLTALCIQAAVNGDDDREDFIAIAENLRPGHGDQVYREDTDFVNDKVFWEIVNKTKKFNK